MPKISEDATHYLVEYDEGGFVAVTVAVRKPCPLDQVFQRAESFLKLPLVCRFSPSITPLQKRTRVEAAQVEYLLEKLAEILASYESQQACSASSSDPESA